MCVQLGMSRAEEAKTKRILIVDDEPEICSSLAAILHDEGYLADTARTGSEAIQKSQDKTYNLAIIDWRLPDIEGTDLASELRETVPRMPRIMLTGHPSMDNAINAVNKRFDAFFPKPVDIAKLLEKIKELLEEQKRARSFSEKMMVNYIETRTKEFLQARDQGVKKLV